MSCPAAPLPPSLLHMLRSCLVSTLRLPLEICIRAHSWCCSCMLWYVEPVGVMLALGAVSCFCCVWPGGSFCSSAAEGGGGSSSSVYELVPQPISSVSTVEQMVALCDFTAVDSTGISDKSYLVCHGVLDKMTKNGFTTLYFWLLNDTLLYGFLSTVNSICHIMRSIPLAR